MKKAVSQILKFYDRLLDCRSGLAAIEFAMLLPVMLILFFGVVESSDALSQNRRVNLAVNTLADLAAQETELLTSDVDGLFSGVTQIIGANNNELTVNLISVIPDPDTGNPMVHWSRDNSGGEPYTPGAAFTTLPAATLLDPGASIIVAEVTYPFSATITHFVMSEVITFNEIATRWPRRTLRVQLCVAAGNCTI